jgi:hypothetical protein
VINAIKRPRPHPLEVFGQADIAVDELDAVGDILDQPQRPGGDQVVDDDHLMTETDQRTHEVAADEAGAARDDHSHRHSRADLCRGHKNMAMS